jgi:diguanylate cyclase (GGDEF)-like protein
LTKDLRLLLVEDSEDDAELVVNALTRAGYRVQVERVDTRDALASALNRHPWDLTIADHTMPHFSGPAALKMVRDRAPNMPFIFVSGTMGEDAAVAAMKNGAHDYIMKDNLKRLVPAVQRELREATVRLERARVEERLAHLAYHDVLTDLPNRMLLYDRLRQAVLIARRKGQPLTLLVMDLDGFKEINDTLGHHAGDQVLQHVAARLRSLLRQVDAIARLGGDEFALILPFTDVDGALLTARKVLQDLARPIVVDGHAIGVRASIGIARYPEHGSSAETLLQKADVAMYLAKADGSGVAVYTPDRDQNTHRRLALTRELERGVEDDQFVLDYQPILDLRTGVVRGVEALARWNHPRHGRLMPSEFVPLAERIGLIGALTGLVLDKALADWGTAEPVAPLTIAVNLSPRSLDDPQLPERVDLALHARHVPPSALTFEVTENIIMLDQTRSMPCLARLHEMGVRLAVDDFGTGYSSLSYLRRLPVDELKIDQSFVADLATTDTDVLVRATIDLGHNLGLNVVAEGVESELARDRLRALGCDSAQGFFISEPRPVGEIRPWITQQNALSPS